MTDSATGTDVPNTPPPTAGKFRQFGQWMVFISVVILVLISAISIRLLRAPDAPVVAVWTMIACGLLLIVLHATPVFFRLPKKLKQGVYAAIPLYFVAFVVIFMMANNAYDKTPQGQLETQQRQKDNARQAVIDAEREESKAAMASALDAQRQAEEYAQSLKACFSTFGSRLPNLETMVKEGLHNPASFEHVETIMTVPDANRHNITMMFRGENAFGAIRTGTITASVNPDNCEVEDIGQPQTD